MRTFPYPSKSSDKVYTAAISDSGRLECDCRGWIIKRGDKPRSCTHTADIIATEGLTTEERNGYLFVVAPVAVSRRQFMGAAVAASVAAVVAKPVAATPAAPFVPARFVNPMLASPLPDDKAIASFASASWVLEEKFDGHRVIVAVGLDGMVEAWSRPGAGSGGKGLSRELPKQILRGFADFPIGTYDGELIMPGGKSPDVAKLVNAPKLKFVVFDLPKLLGNDITSRPFSERRSYLDEIFSLRKPEAIFLSALLPVSKETVAAIWARGGEGAILKRLASTYRPGHRSPDWVKVKSLFPAEVTVTGFEAGECGPYSKAAYTTDDGIDGTVKVLTAAHRAEIARLPKAFIGRRLALEYTEKMASGKFRHAVFDHWV